MKYLLKINLAICAMIQFSQCTILSSQTIILDKLFNESDIIVQGTIKGIDCSQEEIGVVFCVYALQVDSIYKGIPDIYRIEAGEFIQAGQSMTIAEIDKELRITYFSKNCLYYLNLRQSDQEHFEDQCYKVGDNKIVFLKDHEMIVKELGEVDNNVRYNYSMTDQWLSVLPGNSYISEYLRSKVQNK